MSQQDVETLREGYAAFNRQDIPAVLALFDPSIEWDVPTSLPWGGVFHGPDGVGRFFGSLGNWLEELRVEPEAFLDAGDHIVVVGDHHGRVKGGREYEARFAMVWEMRDGKPVRFREYTDTAPLVQALEPTAGAA
jgi:ketosteroid isomerase-like protein